jgi:hypothetical protein
VVHAVRRRGRGQTLILYWFRTPPGVKVGRAPLDEATIHLIERHHPDIRFDWPQILRGEEEAPPSLPAARPGRELLAELPRSPGERPTETVGAPPRRPLAPGDLDAQTLAQLRERYSRVISLVAGRIADPQRKAELNAEARRLNPDAWETTDAKQRGLDEYEAVFASIRLAIGRRRRRRRPRAGGRPGSPDAGSHPDAGDSDRVEEPAAGAGTDSPSFEEENDDSSAGGGAHE